MRALCIQHQDDCPAGLVGERLEQCGAVLEVVDARDPRLPDPRGFDLVVPLGSDDSAADVSLPYLGAEWALLDRAVRDGVPVFGICFGAQVLCRVLGGTVGPAPAPEIGWVTVDTDDPALVEPGPWLAWHLDTMRPGPGSREIARTAVGTQAFVHGPHVGVQFHPEVTVPVAGAWAEAYRGSLDRLGIDPAALVAETAAGAAAARERAFTLVDRLLARAGLPVP